MLQSDKATVALSIRQRQTHMAMNAITFKLQE